MFRIYSLLLSNAATLGIKQKIQTDSCSPEDETQGIYFLNLPLVATSAGLIAINLALTPPGDEMY